MLRLSKIYCNNETIFPDIDFHTGLNVVFAEADKKDKSTDSHSLGKTTLLRLIKFLLLKQIDKKHFLKRSAFNEFIFFLEIEYEYKKYITIKRPTKGKIFIHQHLKSETLTEFSNINWKHKNLSLSSAVELLDDYLKIHQSPTDFTYRSGLRYCFKEQDEYGEIFKINSSPEGDGSWKPYLASQLGFSPQLLKEKYQVHSKKETLKNALKELNNIEEESINKLELDIAVREKELVKIKDQIDNFHFEKSDQKINKELTEEVATNINNLNKSIYNIDQQIVAIDRSLKMMFEFDLDKIRQLFEQVQIYFPKQLNTGYEDLVKLNEEMSSGRKVRLKKTKKQLLEKHKKVTSDLEEQNTLQQKLTKMLLQRDAVEKFKAQQMLYVQEEVNIATLKEQAKQLDIRNRLSKDINDAELEERRLGGEIEQLARSNQNHKLKEAQTLFLDIVKGVLGETAYLYCDVNSANNFEFYAKIQDEEKSLQEGHSYKKILSIIFNVVLLCIHCDESFYRFCYFDGLFETLDDRIKIKLTKKLRQLSEGYDLQLIISVLDSDLPLGEFDNNKVYFPNDEIIRKLHDQGQDGRLFKMDSF